MDNQTNPDYLLVETGREVERLRNQHVWFQICLDGKIIFAPVDLSTPELKVLDVGCADGILLCDLRKDLSPSAQLVGLDVMSTFLPPFPEGNIRYVTGDICEPLEKDLSGAFDLTHIRFVLPGCGRAGVDQAISNLAGIERFQSPNCGKFGIQ
ncbi:methyltransferase domain-containing protein [Colletotrichum incanum]|uniref:Methyltransferase domain-containing protein n=1 Tax=Colletotrichum incanum TaxID=1573173 RepID=A0A162PR72_COLIC|nr:methyltransferase domain-containing protein [Colletotrichum incanum]